MRGRNGGRVSRLGRAGVFAFVLAVGLGFGAVSHAGPSEDAGDAAAQAMLARYAAGLKAAEEGRWEAAREAFSAAWQVERHPHVAANLGRAELMLGKHKDAAEHLSFYLREAKDERLEDREAIFDLLRDARTKIGVLHVRAALPKARVLVDGVLVGQTPVAEVVFVEPGTRVVEVLKDGAKAPEEKRSVDIAAGEELDVDIAMQAPIPPETKNAEPVEDPLPLPRNVVLGVGFTASALGLGAGIALSAIAYDMHATAMRTNDQPLEQQQVKFAWGALGGFVGAAIIGGATTYYAVKTAGSQKKPAVSVSAMGGPGGGMIGLSGHF